MAEDKKASVEKSNICTSSESELLLGNSENSKNLLDPVKQDQSESEVTQAGRTKLRRKREERYCWDECRVPIEIKCPGKYVLSDTKLGQSFILFEPNFFEEDEATELMDILLYTTNWQKKNVTIRGIEYRQPRLVAWYGPFPYSYSGATLAAAKMPDYIVEIKNKVEQYLRGNGIDVKFNSVLLNRYRHNKDSVSWHSDDEMSMGVLPTIASVSFGDTRRFEMRRKLKHFEDESSYTAEDEYFVELHSGNLLIMDGCIQQDWQHRVPKEYAVKYERINLTFRIVYEEESVPPPPVTEVKILPLEKVSKLPSRIINIDDEKSLHSGTNAASSAIVCEYQDLTSPSKSGENCFESPFKAEINNEKDRVTETGSRKITIKIKNELNKPNKEQKPELSVSSDVDNFNDNIGNIEDIVNDTYKEIGGAAETNSYMNAVKSEKGDCSYTETSDSDISNFTDHEIDIINIDNDSYKDGFTITIPHKVTLKTEDELNNPDEERDLQLSYSKRSTSLNFTDDQKILENFGNSSKYPDNVPNSGATARKNKRFRTSSQSTSKDCFQNDDFTVKESSEDNKYALKACPGINVFGSLELKDLLNYNVNLMNCKLFFDYADALKNSILQSIDEFNEPEKSELQVLCKLTNGTQTEENQKIITGRMYCIVDKALKAQLHRQNILKSVKNLRQQSLKN